MGVAGTLRCHVDQQVNQLLRRASGVRAAALPVACRWRHLPDRGAVLPPPLTSTRADHRSLGGRASGRGCVSLGPPFTPSPPFSNLTLASSPLPAVAEMSPTVEGRVCHVLSSYQRLGDQQVIATVAMVITGLTFPGQLCRGPPWRPRGEAAGAT